MTLTAQSPDGTRIGCAVAGDGPALLVVHGSVADHRRWAAVQGALARSFRLYLMDRRGRGLSAQETTGPYALRHEAEDVAAVIAAIGEPVRMLAHSYGGTCAIEALPGVALESLLVYEPAFGTPEGPVFPHAAIPAVEAALARDDRDRALTLFFTRVLMLDDAQVDALRGTPVWEARCAAAHTLAREARAANAYSPDRARLSTVATPVRLLLGTETTAALKRSTRAAHAALPGSDLRELPGHAHAAMDADPAAFVAEVEQWLLR